MLWGVMPELLTRCRAPSPVQLTMHSNWEGAFRENCAPYAGMRNPRLIPPPDSSTSADMWAESVDRDVVEDITVNVSGAQLGSLCVPEAGEWWRTRGSSSLCVASRAMVRRRTIPLFGSLARDPKDSRGAQAPLQNPGVIRSIHRPPHGIGAR